jgi:AraC-like DNA-binding protein
MEGLRRAQRFSGLAIDTLRLTSRTEGELASLVFNVGDPVFSASRHAMEYLLMASVSAVRYAIGADFPLREVHFRHRRTGRIDEAERAFGCPVFFGQPEDSILFPRSALQTVPRFANRSVAEEIEKFAAALSARITPQATISERAEQATRASLASGVRATRANTGRRLGMTSRTLQRKLAEEGTNFRALRDTVLLEAVQVLLCNPALKIEAIALSVGFCDVAAFSRAFRRWKGYPPTRYRETLASSRGARLPVTERRANT